MRVEEMLSDDNENIRAFGKACLDNAIEQQIQENKGKTIRELEAQEMIDDVFRDIFQRRRQWD